MTSLYATGVGLPDEDDLRLARAQDDTRRLWEWVHALHLVAVRAQVEATFWRRVARTRAPGEAATVDPLHGDGGSP